MAKLKSIKTYAEELWKDIEEQRGERPRMLRHMVEKTAADQRHLQILDNEIDKEIKLGEDSELHGLVRMVWGSTGQQKQEVNPLLVQRDKASRTVTDDLKELQLTANSVYKKKDQKRMKDDEDANDPTADYFKTIQG